MIQAENDTAVAEDGTDPGLEARRLLSSAGDALTDDMVSRLSATMGEGLDLLDRVNRSGIGNSLPALAELATSGDLEKVAQLVRVVASAQDAATDDIVARLAETTGGGLDLLDRLNRSGIERVLPAITRLMENGDLERLVATARVLGAVSEAVTEDMIDRFAWMATELISLLDRLTHSDGMLRMLRVLKREDTQFALIGILESVCGATKESVRAPVPTGGIGGLWHMVKDPDTQKAIQFVALLGKHMRLHREVCANTSGTGGA